MCPTIHIAQWRNLVVGVFFILTILSACAKEPVYQPQVLPSPRADESYLKLQLQRLTIWQDANVVVVIHQLRSNQKPVGVRIPDAGYTQMSGTKRAGATDDLNYDIVIPESLADDSAILVTILDVPDNVTQTMLSMVVDGMTEAATGYASAIIKNPFGTAIANRAISILAQEVQNNLRQGSVLAVMRFKVTATGQLVQEVSQDYQAASLTATSMRLLPETRLANQPITYHVVGVKTGGFLNIRTGAGALNEGIGVIPAHATGIVITGAGLTVDDGHGPRMWVPIAYKRTQGWVNASYLAPDSVMATIEPYIAARTYQVLSQMPSNDVRILKVEQSATTHYTIMTLQYQNRTAATMPVSLLPVGHPDAYYLVTGGQQYALRATRGIAIDPAVQNVASGKTLTFMVAFDTLANPTQPINLIEGQHTNPDAQYWDVSNIQLRELH